jgi:hypothetical protein
MLFVELAQLRERLGEKRSTDVPQPHQQHRERQVEGRDGGGKRIAHRGRECGWHGPTVLTPAAASLRVPMRATGFAARSREEGR